jgi:hypothetical protein
MKTKMKTMKTNEPVDWYEATNKYHRQTFAHECQLLSLPEEWQRELAALWRLNADVNNGSYLQFLVNWGKESYVYANQALKKIGAPRMAEIVDQCQALIDEYVDLEGRSPEDRSQLTPNAVIHLDGTRTEAHESILPANLPANVLVRIDELSYEFMDYSDDLANLGWDYYRSYIERDYDGPANRSS